MDTEMLKTAALSDDEINKALSSFRKWIWFGRLCVLFFSVFVLVIILIGIDYGEMSLTVFACYFLAPAAAAVFIMILLYAYAQKKVLAQRRLMGTAVTLPIFKEIFEVKSYQPHGHIKWDLIRAAGLIDQWDEISGSDYIEGSYKGVNILFSDLILSHTETERDRDGKIEEKKVTDFLGQWLICDFGKELAASLRLIERKGGAWFSRTYDIRKSSIETENVAFNKKFRIITDDGHTAFYLLTPHFMEQLTAADEAAKSSTLFCFMDGKVHIALYSGRDLFEFQSAKPGNLDNVRKSFRRDLKSLTDLMDELLRNDRLFKEA